jgi:hypothetical protein
MPSANQTQKAGKHEEREGERTSRLDEMMEQTALACTGLANDDHLAEEVYPTERERTSQYGTCDEERGMGRGECTIGFDELGAVVHLEGRSLARVGCDGW